MAIYNANEDNLNQDWKSVCVFHPNFVISFRGKNLGKQHCAVKL